MSWDFKGNKHIVLLYELYDERAWPVRLRGDDVLSILQFGGWVAANLEILSARDTDISRFRRVKRFVVALNRERSELAGHLGSFCLRHAQPALTEDILTRPVGAEETLLNGFEHHSLPVQAFKIGFSSCHWTSSRHRALSRSWKPHFLATSRHQNVPQDVLVCRISASVISIPLLLWPQLVAHETFPLIEAANCTVLPTQIQTIVSRGDLMLHCMPARS